MKYKRTHKGRFTSTKIRIRKFLLTILLISIASAGYYGWAMEWPEYANAEVNIARPSEDNRTVQEHIWDLLNNESDLTFEEKLLAMNIAHCESRFDPYAIGDNGMSTGIWQIHRGYHPEITKEQSFDVYWSTRQAIKWMEAGEWSKWSCYNIVK